MANWLYNGVELPALPDWDKETYPYACILQSETSAQIMLIVLSRPYQYSTIRADFEGNGTAETRSILCSYAPPNTQGQACGYLPYNGAWYALGTETWDGGSGGLYYGFTGFSNTPVWSNVDIINTDSGNVYFHTSSPIRLESKLSINVNTLADGYKSYNGVELPDIESVWTDKTAQPFAFIATYSQDSYLFLVPTEPGCRWYQVTNGSRADWLVPANSLVYVRSGDGWSLSATITSETAYAYRQYGTYTGKTTYAYNPFWSTFEVRDDNNTVICEASFPTSVEAVRFNCSNLDSTDSVYKIAAWCYPKGTHYLDAPFTYVSTETFAGTEHTETWGLTGLTPGVEYELYACILVDNVATDHNALVTFTTNGVEELDFSNATLIVSAEEVYYNHYVFALDYEGLPYRSDGRSEIFDIVGWTDAGDRAVMGSRQSSGSGTVYGTFVNLEPLTDYTATFEVYYNGQPTGVTATVSFTTEEEYKRKGYDRDSFLLGFASGLGATAATKADAEHNSWMQGYIVGSALAAAIRGGSTGDDTFDDIQSADGYTLLDLNGVYLIPKEDS